MLSNTNFSDPKYDLEADYTEAFRHIHNVLKSRLIAWSVDRYTFFRKVGEGYFGQVFQVQHCITKEISAVKCIKMRSGNEFPIGDLREIRVMLTLQHENLLRLKEICYNFHNSLFNSNAQFYLVVEFCERNLTQLIAQTYLPNGAKKALLGQLFKGLSYLHSNHVMHRDLKPCNILVNDRGVLKIGDFGLSRFITQFCEPDEAERETFTGPVITLWYRPPEILFNDRQYGKAVDMWSVGCIMAEFWTRYPILQGVNEYDQLLRIITICGSINSQVYPGVERLNSVLLTNMPSNYKRRVRESLSYVVDEVNALDLIDKLLVCDPKQRITVDEALSHEYFHSIPPPAPLNTSNLPQFGTQNYFYCNYFPYIADLSAAVVPGQGGNIVPMPLYPFFQTAGFSMFYPIFF